MAFDAWLTHPNNPARLPDSRFQRASYFVDNNLRFDRKHDDEWVRKAMTYLRARRRCDNEAALQCLARSMPDIHHALALFLAPPSMQRWELEAHLLAEQTFAEIAARCSLSPAVIEAYHAMFFDVQERLQSRGYIFREVIGPKFLEGLTEGDVDVILKAYGYMHGPCVLDTLVRYYKNPPIVPDQLDGLSVAELEELRLMLGVRLSILARTLPTTPQTAAKLLRTQDTLEAIGERIRRGATPSDVVVAQIQDLLDGESGLGSAPSGVSVSIPDPVPDRKVVGATTEPPGRKEVSALASL